MRHEFMCASVEDAISRLVDATPIDGTSEIVALDDALGRIAAEGICAAFDYPPFDRSPLDGYAVRAADTFDAGKEKPAVLRVVGQTMAGMPPAPAIHPGEAVRIMTGAPIPPEADCIVRQEDTNYGDDTVEIYVAHRPYQNYCYRGEDVRQGTCAVRRGTVLDSAAIGVLALLGLASVPVLNRPAVGLLTTGDELEAVGTKLAAGKIYNSNQHLLTARIKELGGSPHILPKCADDPACIAGAIERALEDCRFLVTTGGVSVGKKDYMPTVCHLLGEEPLFHGIPMKPGSPALAFRHRGGLVLCLSGNPFAAAATFDLLAYPVIQKVRGLTPEPRKCFNAILQNAFPKASKRRRFLRARVEGGKVYLPDGGAESHSSGVLFSMLGCNCLVDIPAGTPALTAGQEVTVVLTSSI